MKHKDSLQDNLDKVRGIGTIVHIGPGAGTEIATLLETKPKTVYLIDPKAQHAEELLGICRGRENVHYYPVEPSSIGTNSVREDIVFLSPSEISRCVVLQDDLRNILIVDSINDGKELVSIFSSPDWLFGFDYVILRSDKLDTLASDSFMGTLRKTMLTANFFQLGKAHASELWAASGVYRKGRLQFGTQHEETSHVREKLTQTEATIKDQLLTIDALQIEVEELEKKLLNSIEESKILSNQKDLHVADLVDLQKRYEKLYQDNEVLERVLRTLNLHLKSASDFVSSLDDSMGLKSENSSTSV